MSVSPATYATTPGIWSRYPEHLPPDLRAREPVEEWWTWESPAGPTAVHLDRVPSPDAPCTVVLLHGGGGYGRMFTQVTGLVSDGAAETVAPDLPGYGLTRPAGAYSYDDWRACAAALVRAEHTRSGRPVVLLGGSMGGLLAYDTAAAVGPDVVAGVVATTLLDPRDPRVRAAVARWSWLGGVAARLLAAARPLDRLRVPIAWLVDMAAMSNDPRVNALVRADPLGGGNRVPLRFLRTWLHATPVVEPEEFTVCPVLLAHPAADRWTPTALSTPFLERIAAPTELVPLPEAGHFPLEPAALDVLRTAVTRFLERVAPRR